MTSDFTISVFLSAKLVLIDIKINCLDEKESLIKRERKSHKNQRYQNEIQILFFEKGKLTRSNWHEKN